MRLAIRLFAVARQRVGSPQIEVDLPIPSTVGQLRDVLARSCPALADLLPSLMIAVDSEFAEDPLVIPVGAEVAIIPPVSGGAL